LCVPKRLCLLAAVCALAVCAPLSAGAAARHPPKSHAVGNGGKQQKSCHNLPCH
jgi:hypothetical protein